VARRHERRFGGGRAPALRTSRFTFALAIALAANVLACKPKKEIVVFHAASLSRFFVEVGERFERAHPKYKIRAEPSGSQVAARKVAELGLKADLVVVADIRVVDQLLLPSHADWTLGFATNEIVLAHASHSRFTEEVTTATWPEVLTRPDVRLGRVDPDLAPIGYQALIVWKLTEQKSPESAGLSGKLAARCSPEHVVSDESELVALLESRAVDYAFLYRSTADDHRLKMTELPAEANLGRTDLASAYDEAEVEVRMKSGASKVKIRGAPLLYGLAIPRNAPNPEGALLLTTFILEEEGRAALTRSGFRPTVPAKTAAVDKLPPALRHLTGSSP
jgi:molybdate/tungstate transport system substrate-binding protein